MRQLLQIILVIFILGNLDNEVLGQVDLSDNIVIKDYAKRIDSINRLDRLESIGLMHSISEGVFKGDDIIVGGFGIYTLSNLKGDSIFRIEYHDNLDVNIYKVYYFKNNVLVYATLELHEFTKNDNLLYRREEIYNTNKIVWALSKGNDLVQEYSDKVNISLYNDGMKYFQDFIYSTRR